MNTIRELKAKEKYDNMLKRKNKEKNIYKSKNSTLRIEKMNLIKAVERKDKEIERLNNIRNKAIEYINENWGHWCSNHCKYATETINILKGVDKE